MKLWHIAVAIRYAFFTKTGLLYFFREKNDRKVIDAWHAIDDKMEARIENPTQIRMRSDIHGDRYIPN